MVIYKYSTVLAHGYNFWV